MSPALSSNSSPANFSNEEARKLVVCMVMMLASDIAFGELQIDKVRRVETRKFQVESGVEIAGLHVQCLLERAFTGCRVAQLILHYAHVVEPFRLLPSFQQTREQVGAFLILAEEIV